MASTLNPMYITLNQSMARAKCELLTDGNFQELIETLEDKGPSGPIPSTNESSVPSFNPLMINWNKKMPQRHHYATYSNGRPLTLYLSITATVNSFSVPVMLAHNIRVSQSLGVLLPVTVSPTKAYVLANTAF